MTPGCTQLRGGLVVGYGRPQVLSLLGLALGKVLPLDSRYRSTARSGTLGEWTPTDCLASSAAHDHLTTNEPA